MLNWNGIDHSMKMRETPRAQDKKLAVNNKLDYYHSDNEGHIFIKLVNRGDKTVWIKKGEAFAQGIIQYYDKTVDDDVGLTRNGGFGSTNK